MSAVAFKLDPEHSTIEFAVTFAMNTIVKGRFLEFDGELDLDAARPQRSAVSARIDSASLTTDHDERDEHLHGAEFLDVEQHARITFESDAIEVVDDSHWRVSGELTMRGHTRQVTLDTRYFGTVEDARGTNRAGFVAETDIQRSDWGMTWNEEQETGSLVSDRVRIAVFISAIVDEEAVEGEDGDEPDTDGAAEVE